jgi:transcriptional regulator with XRE-family HTH domain
MEELDTFGKRLKSLRCAHGLSQVKLARRVSLSDSYIWYLEADQRQPSLAVLHRLAAYFDVEPIYLRHGNAVQQARHAMLERRQATRGLALRALDAIFAACSGGDIVTCETHTMTSPDDKEVTTITLIKQRGSEFLYHPSAQSPGRGTLTRQQVERAHAPLHVQAG